MTEFDHFKVKVIDRYLTFLEGEVKWERKQCFQC